MGKFEGYGVMRFSIECDTFVGDRRSYPTAESFLEAALSEDAGYELERKNGWTENQTYQFLLPHVSDNCFVVHRVGSCPGDPELDDWWAFTDRPGRGHIKVWCLDMEAIKKLNSQQECPVVD